MNDLKRDLDALRIERQPERPAAARWIVWTGLIVLLAAAGLAGYRWITRERPVEVQVATVSVRAAGTQAAVLNASGYVVARRRATVSSKITGKVVEVDVEEGKNVVQGQVLARLDDSSPRAALALAEAQAEAARHTLRENEVRLDQARLNERRAAQLLKERIVSQSQLDDAKAEADSIDARIGASKEQIRVAERQIEVQQADLDNYVIRAPFSGVAISKDAQPGEMVSPVSAGGGFTRTGICTIVDMHSLEIEVDVNESYISRVSAGQDVDAVLDAYPDWHIPARVITLVPTADRQKATVLVRLAFKQLDPRILPDMAIKVTFLREGDATATASAQPTALVPRPAIRTVGADNFAFVLRGDAVERRAVRLGGTDGDRVEVLAGLQSGDRVVVSPSAALADGSKVIVQ
ncbi:MAG TPA: efflux RND transporter periplasmic adaptor subunit [Vicinamibacterales bacterium]|jgi:RND family efflux transporter MFP subunit|nr:efflux RND transporter periplasmic adaptor subunit [Vicinamibacterales bacterium]